MGWPDSPESPAGSNRNGWPDDPGIRTPPGWTNFAPPLTLFDTLDDARRHLALWRYDYNNVRPHSSLENKTPAEARRALEQFEGSAHDALAQPETDDYQPRRLSL